MGWSMNEKVQGYIDDVLDGRRVVGRWERAAVERHVRDLETGQGRGLWFDEWAGQYVIDFFGFLHHSKGEWAGQVFALEGWQMFLLWVMFGWKRTDGLRRFRTAYIEIARKNGKSTLAAGIGLYLLDADGEAGAEIYTAATKRDQARIVHQEAIRMVKRSGALSKRLRVFEDNIHVPASFSKDEPLGRDADTMDGLNVHGAIVDEFHAHPTGDVWDVLETGTGSRRQPLMVAITTAGHNRQSICYQFHDYTEKVLGGVLEDDAWFGVIYGLDRKEDGTLEDWEDEGVWMKANPNLGVSKHLEGMRQKAQKARSMPARVNAFMQKELNVWTQASQRWVAPEVWQRCNWGRVDEGALAGRVAYGGLDLSSTLDVTALVWVFPGDGPWPVVARLWMPEENVEQRVRDDRAPYDAWIRGGWMMTTPGNVVDYEFILAQVRADMGAFKVAEVAFDPWNATSVSNALIGEGVKMVEFRQGFVTMNPAMKALEVGLKQRSFNHGGHPGLTWMADNVVVSRDASGNQKPDKARGTAGIDALSPRVAPPLLAAFEVAEVESVYGSRGIRTL